MGISIPCFSSKPKTEEYPSFTNFTIKVDMEDSSWRNTVRKVRKSVQGVRNCTIDENGKMNISGYIDPDLFFKILHKLGKAVELVHWQDGECSSNLFEKTKGPSVNYGNTGYNSYPYGYGDAYNNSNYGRRNNYSMNLLECPVSGGNACDCSGHHIEKPSKSSPSSSKDEFHKLSSHPPKCCPFL